MEFFLASGVAVAEAVLALAAMLKHPAAPGLVTLFLLLGLAGALAHLMRVSHSRIQALRWLSDILRQVQQAEFSHRITEIDNAISQHGLRGHRGDVAAAWREYRETLVLHEVDGTAILRNSVRPGMFFNLEDLHFGAGFWRIVPGLFVTCGLFLTFLGLISALSSMDLLGDTQRALGDLLTIASAKFIMSLTGLACSILFTFELRRRMGQVERQVHALNRVIEQRLSFISLEALAVEQLRATHESRDHFRQIGMEMVAELGRPLREELPAVISASISDAIAPVIAQVGQMGSQGVGDMVKDLSSRFSDDVGRALSQASDRLALAGDRIGSLADRMDQSAGRMGSEMEGAVARLGQAVDALRDTMASGAASATGAFTEGAEVLLATMNTTLQGIRDNTGEGARAMSAAAADMRSAAEGIRTEMEAAAQQGAAAAQARMAQAGVEAGEAIGKAGSGVLDAFDRTAAAMSRATDEMMTKAGTDLIQPIGVIADQLDDMVTALAESGGDLLRLANGLRDGAQATEQAAGAFRHSAQVLTDAGEPIRISLDRMEQSARQLTETTRNVADTVSIAARSTAENAAATLASAREAIGGHGRSMEATLAALSQVLIRLQGQGERLDTLDDKLKGAFDEYARQVAAAVEGLFGHVRKMQDDLAPALDTLQSVVAQAETFFPQQRRN